MTRLVILDDSSESDEDLELTPTPRTPAPYCDWGVCWDILEMIGKKVEVIRPQRWEDLRRGKKHMGEVRWEYRCRMNAMRVTKKYPKDYYCPEYDVMVRNPRMGKDLVKAMKYKYVQAAMERSTQRFRLGKGVWRYVRLG